MTAATAATVLEKTSRCTEPPTTTHRRTLGRAIHSEWMKLRTLRSTWIGMGGVAPRADRRARLRLLRSSCTLVPFSQDWTIVE